MFEHLDMFMFAGVCLALMAGFPVAFTLAGVALVFAFVGYGAGVFDLSFLSFLPQRIFGTMINEVLIAVPLFIFMGTMLERAKLAEDLLENLSYLFRNIKGGLGVAVCIVGALLAASTGIVGATVVTMGLLALPTMLKRGYDPALATGVIAATGTLGQIIPPSIVLVLLGDVIANAYQQAQLEQGIFTPETISVGQLFAGSLVPGFVLVGLYIIYQIGVAWRYPEKAPTPDYDEDDINLTWRNIAIALAPPILLIVSVLGSILGGIATPTEAAAVGAIGTLLLAGAKLASLQSHAQSRYVVRIIWAGAVALVALIILTTNTDPRLDMLTPAT
ncbi:MAG: TRAP transporter large permease subunit, partial [Alphaproteobacteria bacterium]|nr:TRAP transporter large permease subunit [Alphaproteobacteria bacterium]